MPTFLQAIQKWRGSSSRSIPEDVSMDLLSFKHHLIELSKEIADMAHSSGLMLELPCEPRHSGPPSYYLFRDVRLADSLSVLFRMVILVARGLSQVHLMQPLDREWASSAAIQLCMSAENRNKYTPVEAFFDSLILRVARLASSRDLGNWIENQLQEIDHWMDSSLRKVVHRFEMCMDLETIT